MLLFNCTFTAEPTGKRFLKIGQPSTDEHHVMIS